MSPFDRVLAIAQLMLLAMWEALGVFVFGWNGLVIALVWFVGLWSYNILVAAGVRTYFKLTQPGLTVKQPDDTELPFDPEEDFGG